MKEILEEIELANKYLLAMKQTMLNDKGDCDNVRMHLAKIEGLVKNLNMHNVTQQRKLLFAVVRRAKQADLDYPNDMLLKDFEEFTAKYSG